MRGFGAQVQQREDLLPRALSLHATTGHGAPAAALLSAQ
jgi:hypothetical protein